MKNTTQHTLKQKWIGLIDNCLEISFSLKGSEVLVNKDTLLGLRSPKLLVLLYDVAIIHYPANNFSS